MAFFFFSTVDVVLGAKKGLPLTSVPEISSPGTDDELQKIDADNASTFRVLKPALISALLIMVGASLALYANSDKNGVSVDAANSVSTFSVLIHAASWINVFYNIATEPRPKSR